MQMPRNEIEICLNGLSAVDKYLLVPLEQANLREEPDISTEHFNLRIGSKPVCLNLLDIYIKQGLSVPKELNIFDQYDIWLINFGISILKTGGWQKINQLGFEISYPSGDDDISVTVISNIPSTSFNTSASGDLTFKTGLQLNGQAESKIDEIPLNDFINLGYSGKLAVSSHAGIQFAMEFKVISPKIVSTGTGDNHAEWIIYRDEEPLLGDQLFCQTILTPKDIATLKVKARINCLITGPMGSFPVKLKSEWNELILWK